MVRENIWYTTGLGCRKENKLGEAKSAEWEMTLDWSK